MFQIGKCRLDLAVGRYDTVVAELEVIGRIAEVAAVGEVGDALRRFGEQSLIDPIPDETADQTGFGLPESDIFRHIARAVPHRMGEFFQQDGAVAFFLPQRLLHLFQRGVVHTDNIHTIADARVVIVDGTGGVAGVQIIGTCLNVAAVIGLIADRPDND